MEVHTVTLRIKIDPSTGQNPPAAWNWEELLDLGPDEEVEVVENPGDFTDNDWNK